MLPAQGGRGGPSCLSFSIHFYEGGDCKDQVRLAVPEPSQDLYVAARGRTGTAGVTAIDSCLLSFAQCREQVGNTEVSRPRQREQQLRPTVFDSAQQRDVLTAGAHKVYVDCTRLPRIVPQRCADRSQIPLRAARPQCRSSKAAAGRAYFFAGTHQDSSVMSLRRGCGDRQQSLPRVLSVPRPALREEGSACPGRLLRKVCLPGTGRSPTCSRLVQITDSHQKQMFISRCHPSTHSLNK